MPVSDLYFLSVLVLHFQPQVATIMVEIEHTDGMKTLFHSMLTHQFTRIMHAIVVNNHHSVYRKLASIIRIKAESVDSVFRNFQVSSYGKTYIFLCFLRYADTIGDVFAFKRRLLYALTSISRIVIP